MSEIVASFVGKVHESLVEPVSRPFSYMTHYQQNIALLAEQMKRLVDSRDRVQQAVDMAQRNAEEIESNVVRWLMLADERICVIERFLKEEHEQLRSWRRMNLQGRYSRSREAKKIKLEVVDLIERGKFEGVSNKDPLALALKDDHDQYYYLTNDNAEVIKDIKAALKDENVKRIGVCGVKGVGKTRLLQNVCLQLKEEGVFDIVVRAMVSQISDFAEHEIVYELDLDMECLQGRGVGCDWFSWQINKTIHELMLMNSDVLIILDICNVMEPFFLDILGILPEHKCKIIFTCDLEYILSEMSIERMWKVNILSIVDSWKLFKSVVGDVLDQSPVLNTLAKEVAYECGGLPLPIVVVARALRGKSDYSIWRKTLENMEDDSTENTRSGMSIKMYSSIQLGFNCLESEEAKSMLLLCSLFPKSSDIRMDHLMFYGLGLKLLKDIGEMLMEAKDRVYTLVEKLKASALLRDDASYDHELVRMHSAVRCAAMDISSGRDFQIHSTVTSGPAVWPGRDSTHVSAIWLSFKHRVLDHEGSYFPDLKLLTLEYKSQDSFPSICRIQVDFFVGMRSLNVLHLKGMHLRSLPHSISMLENLQTFLMEHCTLEEQEDLSILETLRNLKILSFCGSNIKRLPLGITQLTGLRILNLSDCQNLTRIQPKVISSFSRLEGLYMKNRFLERSIVKELISLSCLSELEIDIEDDVFLPRDINILFKSLHKFHISIGIPFTMKEEHPRYLAQKKTKNHSWSRTLEVRGGRVSDIVVLPMKNAEAIYLYELSHQNDLTEDEFEKDGDIFSNCHYLELRDCIGVESLINSRTSQIQQIVQRSFLTLESLQLIGCELNFLFLPSTGCLAQLKHLKIIDCRQIKYIVGCESIEEIAVIVFPRLRSLTLAFLPRLLSFSSNYEASGERLHFFNYTVKFPSLEELRIHELDHMLEIWDDKISSEIFPNIRTITVFSNNQTIPRIEMRQLCRNLEQLTLMRSESSSNDLNTFMRLGSSSNNLNAYASYALSALTLCGKENSKLMQKRGSFVPKFPIHNLSELQLWNCNTLLNIFSSSTAKEFPRLQTLRIQSCAMVQFIVDDAFSFPNLTSLVLKDLPNLTAFCTKNFNSNLDCLETLVIARCHQMKEFALEFSTTHHDQGLGEIYQVQGTHIPFFGPQVAFPRLVTLELSDIVSIQKIWDSTQIPTESFCLLQKLVVQKCSNLLQVISWRSKSLTCLEELSVEDCHLLREVFDLQNESCLALGMIKKLRLIKLPSLQHFCKQGLDTPENEIGESDTDNMSRFFGSLFSCYVARHLDKLEVLEVIECNMKQIITRQEDDAKIDIDFSRVHCVKLKDLPNLVRFCSDNQSLRLSSLTTLEVERCPNLETLASVFFNSHEKAAGDATHQMTIPSTSAQYLIRQEFAIGTLSLHHLAKLKEIWKDHQHHILVFKRLTSLIIHGCERLKTLFTPTIVEGLSQLRVLIVDSCKMIEEIISDERSGTTAAIRKIALPQLETIELKNLPVLVSFLSREYMLELPLLLNVRVEDCPQLQTFSPGKIDAPKLTTVQIGESQWEWEGDLERTIGKLFKGEIKFSETEELQIIDPDELAKILDIKLHYNAFRRLKLLHIECCDKELRDFLSKLLFRFQELVKLYVGNCDLLEQLFNFEELFFEDQDKIFTTLEELKLWKLPRLNCIWNKKMVGYVSFKNLKKVDICGCGHLVNMFSPSIARDLPQLQKLKISECEMMEEVVAARTDGDNDDFLEIFLPQLQHLELIGLSNLTTFHSGNHAFEWPCLHTLRIERCPRLKSLTPGFIRTPKSLDVNRNSEESLENKMVGFPQLNQLYLKSLNNFEEIWQENITTESLTELQVLEIDDCGKLSNVIRHDLLPRLKTLERLTIKNCQSLSCVFDLEAHIVNVKHVGSDVFTRMNESTSTNLPDSVPDGLIAVFENLQVLKLSDCYRLNNLFLTSIERCFMESKGQLHPTSLQVTKEQSVKGEKTVKIDYELLPKLNFLDLDLSSLTLDKCLETKNLFPDIQCSYDLPASRQPLFEQISRFERLAELHLVHLGYFEQIWHDELPIRSLHKLRVLSIDKGEKLLKIVPSRTLVNLLELEELYIQHCDSLKQIFDLDGIMEIIREELFPELTVLVLTHLPEMVGIFSKQPTGIPIFQNLRSLRIIHCNSLKSLISASAAKGLQQLKEFKIFGCNKMQVVIVDDEKDAKEHMVFPELRCLVLKHLPHLKSFYQGKNNFKWPVLDEVLVKSVPIMETFAPGAQETPQLTTIHVTFLEKCWKGDLNQTIKFLYENKKWRAATKTVVPEFEAMSSNGQIQGTK